MNSPEMWPRLYVNAILEPDSRKRPQLIREAEEAIWKRLSSATFIMISEQELIAGAMSRLAELKENRRVH